MPSDQIESKNLIPEDAQKSFPRKSIWTGGPITIHNLWQVFIVLAIIIGSGYYIGSQPSNFTKVKTGEVSAVPTSTPVDSSVVKLLSAESEWNWQGHLGNRLLSPQLRLKFKNISLAAIEELEVKADFINVSNNEIFGNALAYVIGYGDTPLQPGYSKTAYLYCDVGYKNDMVALNLPTLVADIYVNGNLYGKIKIAKKYGGVNWDK